MPVDRHVRGARVEVRRLDARDPIEMVRWKPGHALPDLGEGLPAIAAHLHVSVIGPRPDHPGHHGRLVDRDDRAVGPHAVVLRQLRQVARDAHHRDRVAIDALRQVRTCRPRVAAVVRLEHPVAAKPHDARVVRREHEGRVPVEAIRVGRAGIQHVREATTSSGRARRLRLRGHGLLRSGRARLRRPPGAAVSAGVPPPNPPLPRSPGPRGRMLCPRPALRSYRLVLPSCDSE